MDPLIAMYIPHWERAIDDLLIQVALIGVLAVALYGYLRRYYGKLPTLVALVLFEVAAVALTLAPDIARGLGEYGDACRGMLHADYTDGFLITVQYFELYTFAVVSFVALLLAALTLAISRMVALPAARVLTFFIPRRTPPSSPR